MKSLTLIGISISVVLFSIVFAFLKWLIPCLPIIEEKKDEVGAIKYVKKYFRYVRIVIIVIMAWCPFFTYQIIKTAGEKGRALFSRAELVEKANTALKSDLDLEKRNAHMPSKSDNLDIFIGTYTLIRHGRTLINANQGQSFPISIINNVGRDLERITIGTIFEDDKVRGRFEEYNAASFVPQLPIKVIIYNWEINACVKGTNSGELYLVPKGMKAIKKKVSISCQ